jgi:alpha-D-ribose 1-methylphosphonate 5-triphosphate synthase subunit PhnG
MTETATRQHWMAVLARATQGEVDALLQQAGPLPAHELLKAPETGTVMVEGRAGGAMGFSYALGRDGRKARLAAIADALLQDEAETGPLRRGVSALAQKQQAARELASRKAAATKVDFFTLVRGG